MIFSSQNKATPRSFLKPIILTLSVLMTAISVNVTAETIKVDSESCPREYRLLSLSKVEANTSRYCGMIGKWDIVRLAGNASISGKGYHCGLIVNDRRGLGNALCEKKARYEHDTTSRSALSRILLEADWRSKRALMRMTEDNKRNTLITELFKRSDSSIDFLQSKSNQRLIEYAETYLSLVDSYQRRINRIHRMSLREQRRAYQRNQPILDACPAMVEFVEDLADGEFHRLSSKKLRRMAQRKLDTCNKTQWNNQHKAADKDLH